MSVSEFIDRDRVRELMQSIRESGRRRREELRGRPSARDLEVAHGNQLATGHEPDVTVGRCRYCGQRWSDQLAEVVCERTGAGR